MELFYYWFILFIIYSIIGTIVETLTILVDFKKLEFNRGYLIGPYIPIYGVGSILIVAILNDYSNNVILLFFLSLLLCGTLEYFVSFAMEKLFYIRWWDYSNHKYNIHGRVELFRLISFGASGVLVIKLIHPFCTSLLDKLGSQYLFIIGTMLVIIFFIDYIISTIVAFKLKKDVKKIINDDQTDTFKKEVETFLNKSGYFVNRILRTFPNIKKIISKFSDNFKK